MDHIHDGTRPRLTRRQFFQHTTLAAIALGVPFLSGIGRVKAKTLSGQTTISTSRGALPVYLARPEGVGPFPSVIVCHNWYGLNEQVRQVMQRLAQAGILAIAPNLYRSAATSDTTHARLLAEGLRLGQALEDVQNAVQYLRTEEAVSTVGLLAFEYSDGLAFAVAQSNLPIERIAIVYGDVDAPELTEVRLGAIGANLRLPEQRAFGPLVLHTYTPAAGVWEQAVRWLKASSTV
ncbi:MAG: dienelactone hydrolase family protein [Anaerolineae bacterium]|nr:dienelactone hydrolase family protein [Anaerolineae bacterium]